MNTKAARAALSALSFVFVASACGRVGYELSLAGTGGARAGSGGQGTLPTDASAGGRTAQNDASLDATSGGGATSTGGTAASSGGTGPLPDAARPRDASRDAVVDAAPDAGCHVVSTPVSDSCSELAELPFAPRIDGKLDCGLALVPLVPEGWTGVTPTDGAVPWNATAEYAVAWRPDGIYFFIDVTDPEIIDADAADPTWKGDGVELYVDSDGVYTAPPAYDDPGTRQLVVAAPISPSAPPRAEVWFEAVLRSPWQTSELVTVPRVGGYVVEAFVTATDLGETALSLAPGKHIGFDLAINVSFTDAATTTSGGGHRLGQYFLHAVPPAYPFGNVAAFCDPALLAGPDR